MTRNIKLVPEEFYHIYNRGTEKRKIFLNSKDHKRFIALLYVANSVLPVTTNFRGSTSEIFATDRGDTLLDICAYCLMPNHFHLILKEKEEGGISKFMQKLITGYTMYFNKINERNGSLFQGRFKAAHIDSDRYLSYLIAYIHLNPVKIIDSEWKKNGIRNRENAEKFLDNYMYSSFRDYCGIERYEKAILSFEALPEYTETRKKFKDSVIEWLDYRSEDSEVQPR